MKNDGNVTQATESLNPIPPSAYIDSQYYIPLCTIPPLCIGWCLASFKPWSKRAPYLMLTGLSLSVLIVFSQSFPQTCGFHTVSRQLLQPTMVFSILLLPGYRYNINCRFRDAMLQTDLEKHMKLLLRLKWESSYPHLLILFAACSTPQICSILAIAVFTDDFSSSEQDYRAYGNEGFCVTHVYETGVIVICSICYAWGGIKMLRKLKGSKDEFGIATTLHKFFRYVGVSVSVYVIVILVDKNHYFYFLRAFLITSVVYGVGVNAYDVWISSKKFQEHDSKQAGDVELHKILQTPHGLSAFRKQLVDEFAAENLSFWSAVNELEEAAAKDLVELGSSANKVFDLYISEAAPLQVNVSGKIRQKLNNAVKTGTYTVDMFHAAQEEIFKLMQSDSLPRFRRSSHFTEFKRAHQLEEDAGLSLSVAESSRVLSEYLASSLSERSDNSNSGVSVVGGGAGGGTLSNDPLAASSCSSSSSEQQAPNSPAAINRHKKKKKKKRAVVAPVESQSPLHGSFKKPNGSPSHGNSNSSSNRVSSSHNNSSSNRVSSSNSHSSSIRTNSSNISRRMEASGSARGGALEATQPSNFTHLGREEGDESEGDGENKGRVKDGDDGRKGGVGGEEEEQRRPEGVGGGVRVLGLGGGGGGGSSSWRWRRRGYRPSCRLLGGGG